MARIHGRAGRLYVDLTGAAAATPVAFLHKWSADFLVGTVDVTSMGDLNKVYLAGLPDAKGTFTGWYDDATVQLYTAAQDGIARKTYLYPNIGTAQYWFGTALFDFTVAGGSEEGVSVSGSWNAASTFAKVG